MSPNRTQANRTRKPRADKGKSRSQYVRHVSKPDEAEANDAPSGAPKAVTLPKLRCLEPKLIGGERL
jgi:hypothetical protein